MERIQGEKNRDNDRILENICIWGEREVEKEQFREVGGKLEECFILEIKKKYFKRVWLKC